jgi:translation elongation factor aEF-1 beta
MGIAAVKLKILPTSPETDLQLIKEKTKELVEKLGGKNCSFEEEPIAFGLKAIIAFFAWSEDIELEKLEEEIKQLEGVSSIQIIDMRRAFGS